MKLSFLPTFVLAGLMAVACSDSVSKNPSDAMFTRLKSQNIKPYNI